MCGRAGVFVLVGLCLGCPGGGAESTSGAPATTGETGETATGGPGGPTTGGPATGEMSETGGPTTSVTGGPATSGASDSGSAGGDCPTRAQLGVWVWQPGQVGEPAQAAALLEFAVKQGVTHLYVESELLLAEDPERLAMFIAEADAQCVAVELLFGAAGWALAADHAVPLALLADSRKFVDALVGPRPVGLHFDVEPHGLPGWDVMQAAYAGEYLDLLEQMAAELGGSGLSLTVDIPFWYDGVALERDGLTRPLSELVQDRVDRVVVMDYRDHAEPPDGILDNAEAEVAYAEKVGRRVRVAVESTCGLVPEKVTFCEEGAIAMSLALGLATMVYGASAGWDGVAVHDYAAWSVLMD